MNDQENLSQDNGSEPRPRRAPKRLEIQPQKKLGFILGALAMTLGTFALIYSVLTPGGVSWGYIPGIAVGALVCYFAVSDSGRG